MMMPDWLHKRAELSPDKAALIFEDRSYTYAKLDRAVDRAVAALRIMGVRPHDHVATLATNSDAFVIAVFALIRCQAVLVPLNVRLTPVEMRWQIMDSDARWLLYEGSRVDTLTDLDVKVHTSTIEDLHGALPDSEIFSTPREKRVNLQAVQGIIYTSGTTGKPKGAMLTLGNHWWSATGSAMNLGVHDDDRWLAMLPLFHVGGLAMLFRGVIYGHPIILHRRFDAVAANRAIDDQQVTIASVVGTMLRAMIEVRQGRPFPKTLRALLTGGGPIDPELLTVCKEIGAPVVQTYGMTETASQVATLSPGDALRKLGAAGKPLFPNEIRIRGPVGEIGEIEVRGPSICPGYYHRAEDSARTPDGWFQTGDLGRLDEEGYLYVVDRRSDLIISGGENIYPKEVEDVLTTHPAVLEAAIVGVPHPQWGQVPIAYVVPRSDQQIDSEEVIAYCRGRLAGYKVPTQILAVDRLPRNATGKLLRRTLAQKSQAALHFIDTAPGSAQTPYILIHGDFSHARGTWSKQLSDPSARLIAIDRRGNGLSPSAPHRTTFKTDAVDIWQVADQVGVEQVHLVGHSYGALITIQAALVAPDRVCSLHLIEPPYVALLPKDPDVRLLAEQTRALAVADPPLPTEELTDRFFTMLMGAEAVRAIKEKPVWSSLVQEARRFSHQQYVGDFPPERVTQLVESRQTSRYPVTVYSGGKSHPALIKIARHLAHLIGDAAFVEFPHAGHNVQHAGDAFNAQLFSVTL